MEKRRWLGPALGACLMGCSAPSVAQSFSAAQTNVMNHAAQAMAAESFCPQLQVRYVVLTALVLRYGLDAETPAVRSAILSRGAQHLAGLKAAGPEIGCRVAWSLYGDGGENVPGLLARR